MGGQAWASRALGAALGGAIAIAGCFPGAYVLPRIDVPSAPDPRAWFQRIGAPDGAVWRVGVESTKQGPRPCVERATAAGALLWRRTYGVLGEGGHGQIEAGAILPGGALIAVGGDRTRTTLAAVSFDPAGRVRWGREIGLPAKATARVRVLATEDGAVVAIPVGAGVFTARLDRDGGVAWATTVPGAGDVAAVTWSARDGLTLIGGGPDPRAAGQVIARVDPVGELAWGVEVRPADGRRWTGVALVGGPSGALLVTAGAAPCDACGGTDAVVARLDGRGAPTYALRIHRRIGGEAALPAPSGPAPRGLVPMVQAGALRGDGWAVVAASIQGDRRSEAHTALLAIAPTGEVARQRAILPGISSSASLTPRGGDVELEGDGVGRCVIGADLAPSRGCGDRAWDPDLPVSPLAIEARDLEAVAAHPAPSVRDLGPELAATERRDPAE